MLVWASLCEHVCLNLLFVVVCVRVNCACALCVHAHTFHSRLCIHASRVKGRCRSGSLERASSQRPMHSRLETSRRTLESSGASTLGGPRSEPGSVDLPFARRRLWVSSAGPCYLDYYYPSLWKNMAATNRPDSAVSLCGLSEPSQLL